MPKRSPDTEIVISLADELREQSKDAEKAAKAAVPFMEERLTRADAMNRLSRMTPEERAKLITEKGPLEVLKIVRGRR